MAAAVDVDLPGNKKCLLMMMANYADENGFCYPSVSTLAQDAGVSERSVQNYLAEFAEKGIIEVHTRKTESGSTTSNLYRLMLHKAPQIVRARKARNNRCANTAPYPANDDKVGCNGCGEGVQPFPDGGATVAPKPITEPITETVIEPVDDAGASSSTQAVDCADHDHTDATDTHVGTIPASEADDPFLSNLFSQAPDETLPVGLMPQGATRDKFAMHFEWVPSEWFAERCRTSGVNLTRLEPEQQEAILGEFRSYWEARGDTATQAQWEHKLLNQLQRVAARASGQQPYGPATPQQKRQAISALVMDGILNDDHNW
jgi:AraC-like DNA-binding protein